MVKEQSVPTGEIATSRFQGRRVRDVSALAGSIKKNGLINPIHVWDTGSGLELLCGQRRLGAHVANGETEVRAYVHSDISHTAAAVLHWTDNAEREDLGYYEQAVTVGRVLGWDGSEATVEREAFLKQAGLSSPRAKRLRQLWRLVPEVGDLVDSGELTQTEGIEVSRLERAEQLPMAEEYLTVIYANGAAPSRDLEFLKKAVAGKLPEKPQEESDPAGPTVSASGECRGESASPESAPAERAEDESGAAPEAEVADLPDDDQGGPDRMKDRKASGTETVEYGECHDRMRLVMSPKDWIVTVKVPRGSEESRPTQDVNRAFDDKDGGRNGLHLMLSYVDAAAKMARDKAKG